MSLRRACRVQQSGRYWFGAPHPRRATVRWNSSSNSTPEVSSSPPPKSSVTPDNQQPPNDENESALARRFEALAEDAIAASPSRAAKIAAENPTAAADELKQALEARLAAAEFASTNAQAISIANMPASAPKHSRDIAGAKPWTGEESTEDAVLRMLVDTHKPLKGELAKGSKRQLPPVDLRPRNTFGPKVSGGARLARAREKTTEYAMNKEGNLSPEEKEQMQRMLKDRFLPEARAVATVQALASLADQRIEDAIARGQFKNLPRGKPLERDHNASSPFMDTTEYFLNKIIQKQEILPPWVEKQQEVQRTITQFRGRLRHDWKRHVARSIAARGGSTEEQCQRAEAYAKAEARLQRLERRAKMLELGEEVPEDEHDAAEDEDPGPKEVFRDPEWVKTERSYHELAITELNHLMRSYNLMAPELAKKPYFSLERELRNCYAEVAPQVAEEIRERSKIPPKKPGFSAGKAGGDGWVNKLGVGESARVYDSQKPNYGFKEFWKDLFGSKST